MSAAGTTSLPVLRPDVEFHRGPDDADGSPTYTLHDPLRGTFEKLTWVQAEILSRLRGAQTADQLVQQLRARTTLHVSPAQVQALCADVHRRGLTRESCRSTTPPREATLGPARRLAMLFRQLLFLRIPLLRPDAFLTRSVDAVRWLGRPATLVLYALLGLVGILLLAQRFDAYLATFPYFFNAAGLAAFVVAIAGIKTVHEFSHAYVAKALGNRVPSMGIVLIYLFPVAFADVTDSWRMRSRRQRLMISLAGVIAELVIAAGALVIWALSPPGIIKSLCFVLSSASLLSTLLINLNPAMRFDGYYVLSDLLGLDNLQPRAFLAARWTLRRHLLGVALPAPEVGGTRRRHALLLGYALYAWVYRLFIYTGIALMLYHRVAKVLGTVLFVLALYTFLVQPVVSEMRSLFHMRRLLSWNARSVVTMVVLAAMLAWAAYPQPHWRTVPAVTTAGESQVIYAPTAGVLADVHIAPRARVAAGDPLFILHDRELEEQQHLAELELERIDLELALVKAEPAQRALLPQKLEERARATAHLDTVRSALERQRCRAQTSGVVVEWDETLRPGTPVGVDQVLGRIVDPHAPQVRAYVPHDLVADLRLGQPVRFCAADLPGPHDGTVTFIEPVRTVYLDQPALASLYGGEIPVRPDEYGRLNVIDSLYPVEITLVDNAPRLRVGQTGTVWLRTAPRSRLADLGRYLYRVLIRESSF